jgi:ribokinase
MVIPMPDVTVVGSANIDFTVPVPRLPSPGETVLGGDLAVSHGGKGANQAVAASRAGATVAFMAKVGRDGHGHEIRRHLLASGLSLDAIVEDPEVPSGVAFILVEPQGGNQIVVAPGSNMRLTPADLEPYTCLLQGCRVLLTQLETPLDTVRHALGQARRARAVTVLNPAPARPLPDEVYPLVDYLTPNESEATALSGIQVRGVASAREAARRFLAGGCRGAIITMGAAGAVVATQDMAWHYPAFPVEAVDSTAAGDAFNGVLAARLARGEPLEEAVRWAGAAGALACTRRGAQESLPDMGALKEFLAGRPVAAPAPIR